MEKYSVLMSLYAKEQPEYLKLAIKSMVEQSVIPDEIVIVKDGKITCELQAVLDEYRSTFKGLFNIVGYEDNRGLGLALNYGLEKCRNELIARMDTDDISKPERCEKQIQAFEKNPYLSIVGTNIDEFCVTTDDVISTRIVPQTYSEIYKYARRRSAFNHPTVMFRKSDVLVHGGYANLRRNQDVDLFGRMLFSGCKAENLGESLLFFRCSDQLAERRKSWDNTKSYIETIKKFCDMGYSSFGDYFIVAVAQTVIFILPVKLQQMIYRTFLRRRV